MELSKSEKALLRTAVSIIYDASREGNVNLFDEYDDKACFYSDLIKGILRIQTNHGLLYNFEVIKYGD